MIVFDLPYQKLLHSNNIIFLRLFTECGAILTLYASIKFIRYEVIHIAQPYTCLLGYGAFFLFYLPYLSSIHEKANCIAILWTISPHSLGSCLFRGFYGPPVFHIKVGRPV